MKKSNFRWVALLSLLAGIAGTSNALAASTWTFNSTSTATKATQSGSDPTLQGISGVSTSNVATGKWATTPVTYWSGGGLAMESDGSNAPNHAVDNAGNTEAVLLNFSSSVALSSIGLGYATNAAGVNSTVDISLFRWIGPGTPPSLDKQSAAAMTGWQLVGNYGDMVNDSSNPYNAVNSTGLGSSWWLISAYNSGYTSAAAETRLAKDKNGNDIQLDNSDDFFKIYAVAGATCTNTTVNGCTPTTSTVPEPASIALMAVGLLGAFGTRRRSGKPAKAAAA